MTAPTVGRDRFEIVGGTDASGARVDIALAEGAQTAGAVDTDADRLDASGLTVVPGLIDLQVNGAFGHDFTDDPESIWEVGARLVAHGVTAFCPTIITAPHDRLVAAVEAISRRPAGYVGAEPLGLHVEGPHIAPEKRGTHPLDLITPARDARVEPNGVAIVTLAPESDGARDLIETLTKAGVVVSLGHSAAGAACARSALDAGATMGTHIFNAMPPIAAREPGLTGVLLTDPRAYVGLIADGHHHAEETIRLVWSAASDRLIVVTDAIAALGMPDGAYRLGGVDVVVGQGIARNTEGALAGAVTPLPQALALLQDVTRAPFAEVVATATRNPARALGDDTRGALGRGRGDLTLLAGTEVAATVVGGVLTHLGDPNRWRAGKG